MRRRLVAARCGQMHTHCLSYLHVGNRSAKEVIWHDVGGNHPALHASDAQLCAQTAWGGMVEVGKLLRGATRRI